MELIIGQRYLIDGKMEVVLLRIGNDKKTVTIQFPHTIIIRIINPNRLTELKTSPYEQH